MGLRFDDVIKRISHTIYIYTSRDLPKNQVTMSCDPSFLWQTRSTEPICSNILLTRLLIGCSTKESSYKNGRLPLPKIHARSLQIFDQFLLEILFSTHTGRLQYHWYALIYLPPSEFLMVNDGTSRMHRFFSTF